MNIARDDANNRPYVAAAAAAGRLLYNAAPQISQNKAHLPQLRAVRWLPSRLARASISPAARRLWRLRRPRACHFRFWLSQARSKDLLCWLSSSIISRLFIMMNEQQAPADSCCSPIVAGAARRETIVRLRFHANSNNSNMGAFTFGGLVWPPKAELKRDETSEMKERNERTELK